MQTHSFGRAIGHSRQPESADRRKAGLGISMRPRGNLGAQGRKMASRNWILLGLVAFGVVLAGCNALQPSVFDFYDACNQQTSSFVAMAECGKRGRNDACTAAHACSAIGNAAVQYADALSEGVQSHQLSDAEARQRWITFKIAQINHQQNLNMQSAAIMAGSGPTSCFSTGNSMIGYSTTCH